MISRPGWVHRVDTRTGHRRTLRSFRADVIAAGDGQVWISADRELIQLDPATGRASARVPLAAESVDALAVGDGAVWATDQWAGVLWRVDPERRTARTIEVGKGADSVAVGAGAVWVASSQLKTVSRIDPAGHRVAARIRVPGTPRGLAVGGGRVWVSVAGTRQRVARGRRLAADARLTALPGPPCGGVLTDRRGDPDYLIASDLPLGFQRESTLPMSAAVAFVLQQHDFRAGRFTLGLQSCDDAAAETGRWDPLKCRQNAHGYANNPAVIGIVGPLNSSCAAEMLPILNTAPGRPARAGLTDERRPRAGARRAGQPRGCARRAVSDRAARLRDRVPGR